MADLIKCPKCGEPMKVQESRIIINLNGDLTKWRRKICKKGCGTTTRTVEIETAITDWTKHG